MFSAIKLNGEKIYKNIGHRRRIQYKFLQKLQYLRYKKFRLIIDLKALKGIEFLKFNLKKIELAKDIFVKEIENGKEV